MPAATTDSLCSAPSGCRRTDTSTRTAPRTRSPRLPAGWEPDPYRRASPGSSCRLGREVTAVLTDRGRVETETVVNACGIWARSWRRWSAPGPVDARRPPARALKPVPGHELPRGHALFPRSGQPRLREGRVGRDHVRRLRAGPGRPLDRRRPLGALERAPRRTWPASSSSCGGAARRFPFLADAEIVALVCHPDAMTPDAQPLLGPIPGMHGFVTAAGLSLNGFGGAGGIGKSIAEWVTSGKTEVRRERLPGRGASARHTETRSTRPRPRGRPTATTTASAIPTTRTNGAVLTDERPARTPAGPGLRLRREERVGTPGLRPAGPSLAAGRGGPTEATAGRCRPGSSTSGRSTPPSASGPG